jgi:hypothetical protein
VGETRTTDVNIACLSISLIYGSVMIRYNLDLR